MLVEHATPTFKQRDLPLPQVSGWESHGTTCGSEGASVAISGGAVAFTVKKD